MPVHAFYEISQMVCSFGSTEVDFAHTILFMYNYSILHYCLYYASTTILSPHRTCGLVAMTSAPHAEGRQLDPGQVYHFARAHLQLMKGSSSIPVSQVIELRKDRHGSRWRGPVEHRRALRAR